MTCTAERSGHFAPATARIAPGAPTVASLFLFLTACALAPPFDPGQATSRFITHMIVLDSDRRWQASVEWQATSPDDGLARLSHIASGRVVEVRWRTDKLWLRDNQGADAGWHRITARQLSEYGITLLPADIVLFLNGKTPAGFTVERTGEWFGNRFDHMIRIEWKAQQRQLSIRDLDGGRQVLLNVRG